ncbi:MAG TPA: DUF5916 domain-containing protein [Prolixibacteraceae bacterium]|nr:DUF5916 domain-containing protein [Prolixibacteraceae bacterium]
MQKKPTILTLFFMLLCLFVLAQTNTKYTLSADTAVNRLASFQRVYIASRTEKKPKIDGKLNDQCWEGANWTGNFIQQIPKQGKNPTQNTLVKILYDDNNIYVAFKCFDKGEIRSILNRRDVDASAGDIVGIAFDSYNDNHTAYEFNLTAAGQKIDMVHLGANNLDYNWDAVWDGKAHVSDTIWTAEMQIPFSQLRFSPGENQVWGVHVWRWIDRNNENDQWKLIPVDAPAMVYLFGDLKGIEGVKPKTNYEFLPYVNSSYSTNTIWNRQNKYGAGLNGKVGLNSGLTLDYAINPDFGQVESDPAVLNLTSYEVFNDEKRPFFLEGNTVLDYSIGSTDMLYYSRRIGHEPSLYSDVVDNLDENQKVDISANVPILSALKLTGKTKKGLSVGVVQSFTAKERATIYCPGFKTDTVVEPFTNFMVGRLKQDFNKGQTVLGGMITSTQRNIKDVQLNFLPKSSTVGGIDFEHNWKNRKYFLDFKGFFSDINGDKEAISGLQLSSVHYYQRPDASHLDYDPERTSLTGTGGFLSGGKRSGRFRAVGTLNWRSPGVDFNDLGYLYQADLIQQIADITYKVNKPKGIVRSYYGQLTQQHEMSWGRETTLDRINLHGFVHFNNLWMMHLNLRSNFNIFDTRELRGGPMLYKGAFNTVQYTLQTNSVKKFYTILGPLFAWSSDDSYKGSSYLLQFQWQISNRFSVMAKTVLSENVDANKFAARATDAEKRVQYFVGEINRKTLSSTLRIEYYISPEISIQYYGNPYSSVGTYTNFRQVINGSARSFNDRYASMKTTVPTPGRYLLTDSGASSYNIKNPDFNYQEFRSNLVGRWEFRPGSTLYLVWTNTRSAYSDQIGQSVWKSFGDIWNVKSENVFMLKLSYWFSL